MMHAVIKTLDKVVHFAKAEAHCDIPCKIYDPFTAQLAALSCVRYLDLIQEINAQESLTVANMAQLARLVGEKEKACSEVKEAVRVIWGDYFKEPQFNQVPQVHDLVHGIMMQASKCKQGIDRGEGEVLVEKVNEFATAFWLTKNVTTYRAVCPYPPLLEIVYPQLQP